MINNEFRYALQCESLKVDASLVRSQLTEMTKMSNKETITELTERLEAAERDNADLREQLSELNDDKEKHDSINNTNNISTKLNEPFQPEDFHFPQVLLMVKNDVVLNSLLMTCRNLWTNQCPGSIYYLSL